MRVYLAGPDVFRPDIREWAESSRALCWHYGHEAVTPIDHEESEAPRIFQANLDLIRSAEVVVANLNPFRGMEPDAGTCFEIGYAYASGKMVYGYLSDTSSLRSKINRTENADDLRATDNAGMLIENFGLPVNLMLGIPVKIVEGGLEECIQALRDGNVVDENPLKRRAQEAAVRYLRWATAGKIHDQHAVATVAGQYEVTPVVVEGWLSAWSGVSTESQAEYRPDDVLRQMKIQGRQYRQLK